MRLLLVLCHFLPLTKPQDLPPHQQSLYHAVKNKMADWRQYTNLTCDESESMSGWGARTKAEAEEIFFKQADFGFIKVKAIQLCESNIVLSFYK